MLRLSQCASDGGARLSDIDEVKLAREGSVNEVRMRSRLGSRHHGAIMSDHSVNEGNIDIIFRTH